MIGFWGLGCFKFVPNHDHSAFYRVWHRTNMTMAKVVHMEYADDVVHDADCRSESKVVLEKCLDQQMLWLTNIQTTTDCREKLSGKVLGKFTEVVAMFFEILVWKPFDEVIKDNYYNIIHDIVQNDRHYFS